MRNNTNSRGQIWPSPDHSRITHSRKRTAPRGHRRTRKPRHWSIRRPPEKPPRTLEDMAPTRFGTVTPRVQIPGPRPISQYDPGVTAHAAMAMDHSWITLSCSRSEQSPRLPDLGTPISPTVFPRIAEPPLLPPSLPPLLPTPQPPHPPA